MIVKLHTTQSTNSYLKEWITKNNPENFMVVVTESQTLGRGQMGTKWISESGKNLTFSIFIKLNHLDVNRQFALNQAVSLGLLHVLKKYLPNVQIKWPNDILADTKKIVGILIENTVSKNSIKHSIVGIGLNVNQTKFPKEIPNASSLKSILDKNFNLDILLQDIITSIKQYILLIEKQPNKLLQEQYLQNLYLYQQEANYKNDKNEVFVGKITGITDEGRLQVQTKNKNIVDFGFKEIEFF